MGFYRAYLRDSCLNYLNLLGLTRVLACLQKHPQCISYFYKCRDSGALWRGSEPSVANIRVGVSVRNYF